MSDLASAYQQRSASRTTACESALEQSRTRRGRTDSLANSGLGAESAAAARGVGRFRTVEPANHRGVAVFSVSPRRAHSQNQNSKAWLLPSCVYCVIPYSGVINATAQPRLWATSDFRTRPLSICRPTPPLPLPRPLSSSTASAPMSQLFLLVGTQIRNQDLVWPRLSPKPTAPENKAATPPSTQALTASYPDHAQRYFSDQLASSQMVSALASASNR